MRICFGSRIYKQTRKEWITDIFTKASLLRKRELGPLDIFEFKVKSKEIFRNVTLVPLNATRFLLSELPEPKVNLIALKSIGDENVCIPEGLMILGLKQARMTYFDQVIEPGEMQEIEVLCVEEKRWSESMQQSYLYKRAPLSVIAALRISNDKDIEQTQSNVWKTVERYGGAHLSETLSLPEMMERQERGLIWLPENPLLSFRLNPEANAVAIALGGEPLLLEAFADHKLLEAEFQGIVESVLADLQHIEPKQTSEIELWDFLEQVDLLSKVAHEGHFTRVGELSVNKQSAKTQHLLAINHNHQILA